MPFPPRCLLCLKNIQNHLQHTPSLHFINVPSPLFPNLLFLSSLRHSRTDEKTPNIPSLRYCLTRARATGKSAATPEPPASPCGERVWCTTHSSGDHWRCHLSGQVVHKRSHAQFCPPPGASARCLASSAHNAPTSSFTSLSLSGSQCLPASHTTFETSLSPLCFLSLP